MGTGSSILLGSEAEDFLVGLGSVDPVAKCVSVCSCGNRKGLQM